MLGSLTVFAISNCVVDWVDWLTWPADLLLSASGYIAKWFLNEDAASFTVLQMGLAMLIVAAVVPLFAYWGTLVGYWRSRGTVAGERNPSPGQR